MLALNHMLLVQLYVTFHGLVMFIISGGVVVVATRELDELEELLLEELTTIDVEELDDELELKIDVEELDELLEEELELDEV
jgi:hypothetical protein